MSTPILVIIFYTMVVIMIMGLIYIYASTASSERNKAVIYSWVKSMEATKDGRSYSGERTEILTVLSNERKGFGKYELVFFCRTPSRRGFFLKVTSSMCLVTEWNIIAVDFDQMIDALKEDGLDVSSYEDIENSKRRGKRTNLKKESSKKHVVQEDQGEERDSVSDDGNESQYDDHDRLDDDQIDK